MKTRHLILSVLFTAVLASCSGRDRPTEPTPTAEVTKLDFFLCPSDAGELTDCDMFADTSAIPVGEIFLVRFGWTGSNFVRAAMSWPDSICTYPEFRTRDGYCNISGYWGPFEDRRALTLTLRSRTAAPHILRIWLENFQGDELGASEYPFTTVGMLPRPQGVVLTIEPGMLY